MRVGPVERFVSAGPFYSGHPLQRTANAIPNEACGLWMHARSITFGSVVGPKTFAITLVALLVGAHSTAHADVELERDGAIIAGAAAAALVLNELPVHEETPLHDHEWLRLDDRVRDHFSENAAKASDVSLALTLSEASAFAIGTDPGAGDRALLLGESVAITLAATSLAKVVVARPRPYVYNDDEPALRRREKAGRDAYRSWFSGHAAMSFAAVSTSGLLFADRDHTAAERALVWGTGTMLATTTASLRVRAGRHFYSDVVVGGLVGCAVGTLVPVLHDGELRAPSGTDLAAMGGGIALGLLTAKLLPLGSNETRPLALSPMIMHDGAGVAFGGQL